MTRNTDFGEYIHFRITNIGICIYYNIYIIIVLECTDEYTAVARVSTVASSTALKIKVLHHDGLYKSIELR